MRDGASRCLFKVILTVLVLMFAVTYCASSKTSATVLVILRILATRFPFAKAAREKARMDVELCPLSLLHDGINFQAFQASPLSIFAYSTA